ncbi:hypothetical protein DOTSEDRAFT_35631 [Dothistroma septosporum NZE10]|uniref:Uncharacterized protein n=1 Tax=Dothistroma septosporum (strain NZE10 / CBS 128990) TaxID=675120 RepID=M2Y525_DOTSN|nr:hypothetical protein DOTSEDRAFT_35631 [Dothistroma septosporum NZE10]
MGIFANIHVYGPSDDSFRSPWQCTNTAPVTSTAQPRYAPPTSTTRSTVVRPRCGHFTFVSTSQHYPRATTLPNQRHLHIHPKAYHQDQIYRHHAHFQQHTLAAMLMRRRTRQSTRGKAASTQQRSTKDVRYGARLPGVPLPHSTRRPAKNPVLSPPTNLSGTNGRTFAAYRIQWRFALHEHRDSTGYRYSSPQTAALARR